MRVVSILLGSSKSENPNQAIITHGKILYNHEHKITVIFNVNSACLEEIIKLPVQLIPIKESCFDRFFLGNKIHKILETIKPDIVCVYNEYSYKIIKNLPYPLLYYLGEPVYSNIICNGLVYDNIESYLSYGDRINVKIEDNKYYLPQNLCEAYFDILEPKITTNFTKISICSNKKNYQEISLIMRAFAMIYAKLGNYINFKLYIYCDIKSSYELLRLSKIFSIQNIVSFHDLSENIVHSDIHIITSYNCNNMVLFSELCYKQIFVAALNKGLIADSISSNNKIGILYDVNNLDNIIMILEKILIYPQYRSDITETAYNYIKLNHSSKIFCNLIEKICLNEYVC